MNFIKKNINKIFYIFIGLFLIQAIIYIFIGAKSWLNSDSTFVVDYAVEMLESHSIFPKTWINSNDFWIYSLCPFIAIFIKCGINLYTSRQLSVFIQTIVFLYILYDFCHTCFKDKLGTKTIFFIILSGISGEFIFELLGDGTYTTIILFMLLELTLFIKYKKTDQKKYFISFLIIYIFLSTCSMRFPIYIASPIICYILYSLYENNTKKKDIKELSFIIVAIIIGFLLNTILTKVLLFEANYYKMYPIRESTELSENVFNMIYDYLTISGATGKNLQSLYTNHWNSFIETSSSIFIVFTFIKTIFAIVTITIPFLLIKKFKKLSEEEKILYIFSFSFLLIMIFFLLIGNMAWWHRYLFPILFFLILLYPIFYKIYFSKKEKNKIVFHIAILFFSISSLIFTTASYISYQDGKIIDNNYSGICNFLLSRGLFFGYTQEWNEHNIYYTISNGKIRVVYLNRENTEQKKWLSSIKWVEKDYYQGRVFLIKRNSQKETELEKEAIARYKYKNRIILVFESNDIVLKYLNGEKNENNE